MEGLPVGKPRWGGRLAHSVNQQEQEEEEEESRDGEMGSGQMLEGPVSLVKDSGLHSTEIRSPCQG